MVKLLEANDVDPITEEVEIALTNAEEAAEMQRFARTDRANDLSDGGMTGGAKITPMSGGKRLEKGRAAARRAWMWNGTETVLPLAWNPDGTVHDGARRYLRKRHCLCCGYGGFHGQQCPNCVKGGCSRCNSSTDRKKIIANFYLRKEDVPYPIRFYGSIPCFLPSCIRTGDRGFKTQEEMRMHARSRHRMEYQAHQETMAAERTDEIAILRQRLDAMIAVQPQPVTVSETVKSAALEARIAKTKATWAAKREKQRERVGTTKPATA